MSAGLLLKVLKALRTIAILIIGVCILVNGPENAVLEVLSTAYQNMVLKESRKHPRRKERKIQLHCMKKKFKRQHLTIDIWTSGPIQ